MERGRSEENCMYNPRNETSSDEQPVKVSKIVQGQASEDTRKEENWAALPIPNALGAITLNISGGNCNYY